MKLVVRQGAPRFELGTLRSAVECSATELYPHMIVQALAFVKCGFVFRSITSTKFSHVKRFVGLKKVINFSLLKKRHQFYTLKFTAKLIKLCANLMNLTLMID
jgi:hypothetical protein